MGGASSRSPSEVGALRLGLAVLGARWLQDPLPPAWCVVPPPLPPAFLSPPGCVAGAALPPSLGSGAGWDPFPRGARPSPPALVGVLPFSCCPASPGGERALGAWAPCPPWRGWCQGQEPKWLGGAKGQLAGGRLRVQIAGPEQPAGRYS